MSLTLIVSSGCSHAPEKKVTGGKEADSPDSFSVKSPEELSVDPEESDKGTEGSETKFMAGAGNETDSIQAQDEEWEKKLKEYLKSASAEEQKDILESNQLYKQAEVFAKKNDFQRARELCKEAIKLWPNNHKAKSLLAKLDEIIVGQVADFHDDELLKEFTAQIEGTLMEISHHLREGQRLFSSGEYEKALKEFRDAEFKIIAVPEQLSERASFEATIKDYIQRIEGKLQEASVEKEVQLREKALAEQQALAEAEKKQVIDKIQMLLELAFISFDQKQYNRTIELCNKILDLDPSYVVARELKNDAYKARDKYGYRDVVMRKIAGWKAILRDSRESSIPYQDTLKFPSRSKWREVQDRADLLLTSKLSQTEAETEDMKQVKAYLETNRIEVDYEDYTLMDIVGDLHRKTGIIFNVDNEVRSGAEDGGKEVDIETTLSLELRNIQVAKYLEIVLDYYGLDYFVDDAGIVHITLPIFAKGKPILETYDITDILYKVKDFSSASTAFGILDPAEQLGGGNFLEEEEEREVFTREDVEELIRANIEPLSWDNPRFFLEITENNILIVRHNRKVHSDIREFLGRLRENTGLMVAVRSRFISAYDDFLQDVGVNFFNNNSLAIQDYDINGNLLSGEAVVDDFVRFGPGFINNHAPVGKSEGFDLRGHTFHSLLQRNVLFSSLEDATNFTQTSLTNFGRTQQNIANDPTQGSGRIRNTGGLGLQYQVLGKKAIQFVLRAVSKHSKAMIVEAPRINVLNTRKGYLTQTRVMPYIRDYAVVPIGGTAAHDPEIGYFSDGIKLEIKAIISSDRKYVTLTVNAGVALFRGFREPPLALAAPTGNLPTSLRTNLVTLQLPWIQEETVQMSAIIPDQGTLVIGGLKNLNEKILRAGIPFLENIPILSALFTRKAKIKENENIYILITPEIIDLHERAKEFVD